MIFHEISGKIWNLKVNVFQCLMPCHPNLEFDYSNVERSKDII